MERLDKFLSSQNIGSRKDAAALVKKGLVLINGETAKSPADKLDPEKDVVTVNGKEIVYRKYLYIVMNKPSGVLSATEDKRTPTVLDLLPPELSRRGLFPAGRLDKDTTGLLIITDDGDFAHKMLAPKSHVYKLYEAKTERLVTDEDIKAFEEGIRFGEITFAPARLYTEERGGEVLSMIEIHEGKFHQVKRMFEARDNKVLALKRMRIGKLYLDEDLEEGEARLLSDAEVAKIFE